MKRAGIFFWVLVAVQAIVILCAIERVASRSYLRWFLRADDAPVTIAAAMLVLATWLYILFGELPNLVRLRMRRRLLEESARIRQLESDEKKNPA